MQATRLAKPYICREELQSYCEKTGQWKPSGKYVWVLYDSKYKDNVLTYKDTWVDIVAAAKLAEVFNC